MATTDDDRAEERRVRGIDDEEPQEREPTSLELFNEARRTGNTIGDSIRRSSEARSGEVVATKIGDGSVKRYGVHATDDENDPVRFGYQPERITRAAFDALPARSLTYPPPPLTLGQRWRKKYDDRTWLLARVLESSKVQWTTAVIIDRDVDTISIPSAPITRTEAVVHGVVWVVFMPHGRVVLERCVKKARALGVGEWFLPGGKIEPVDVERAKDTSTTPEVAALFRELGEEWPGVRIESFADLPIIEGSPVPPDPERGVFLMRPFVVTVSGVIPGQSAEGTPLRCVPVLEALSSPVVQVRMMIAAALDGSRV